MMFNQSFQDDVVRINDSLTDRFSSDNSRLLDQTLSTITEAVGASSSFLLSSRTSAGDRVLMAHICQENDRAEGIDHAIKALEKDVLKSLDSFDLESPLYWIADERDPTLIWRCDVSVQSSYFLILSFGRQLDMSGRQAAERGLDLFLPLLKLHLRMVERLDSVSRNLDSVLNVLDNSNVAVMLFDAGGHMILSNKEGNDIVSAQDGLRMGSRSPVPTSLKTAGRFQIALEHAIAENARPLAGGAGRSSTVMKIPRERGRRAFVATLVPAKEAAKAPDDFAVALYLCDPAGEHLDFLEAVCELYDLSKVEARLARHLASGLTLSEAAKIMRIKDPTARTYLKQVFMKTSTHRQADLVRLLILSTGRLTTQALPEAFL